MTKLHARLKSVGNNGTKNSTMVSGFKTAVLSKVEKIVSSFDQTNKSLHISINLHNKVKDAKTFTSNNKSSNKNSQTYLKNVRTKFKFKRLKKLIIKSNRKQPKFVGTIATFDTLHSVPRHNRVEVRRLRKKIKLPRSTTLNEIKKAKNIKLVTEKKSAENSCGKVSHSLLSIDEGEEEEEKDLSHINSVHVKKIGRRQRLIKTAKNSAVHTVSFVILMCLIYRFI